MIELARQMGNPRGLLGLAVSREMAAAHEPDYAAVLEHVPPLHYGVRLLEIGMGCGAHVPALVARGVFYAGVDRSPDMVREAARTVRMARFVCADVCATKLPQCDVAIAVNTLQWWARPMEALAAVKAALSGPLVVGIAYPPPSGLLPEVGQRHYFPGELAGMLRAIGFSGVMDYIHNCGGRPYIVCKGVA